MIWDNWVVRENDGRKLDHKTLEALRLRAVEQAAADRWTWLIITCHAQLRLARPLAEDLRRPWGRPAPPRRLTPPGPQGI